MKIFKLLPLLAFMLIAFNSCTEDDAPNLIAVDAEQVTNLFAPQNGGQGQGPISGDFTKFDFATGQITTSETEWDIAFRATTIIVNGGESTGAVDEPERNGNAAAYIAENTFSEVNEVNTDLLVQDSQSNLAITPVSDMGWYNYSGFGNTDPNDDNLVTPLPGRILVFRTRDGRYAKVDILSYYLDNPINPVGLGMNATPSRYYTFNYVYQPNEGVTTFE